MIQSAYRNYRLYNNHLKQLGHNGRLEQNNTLRFAKKTSVIWIIIAG
jgi:hypothetical protein